MTTDNSKQGEMPPQDQAGKRHGRRYMGPGDLQAIFDKHRVKVPVADIATDLMVTQGTVVAYIAKMTGEVPWSDHDRARNAPEFLASLTLKPFTPPPGTAVVTDSWADIVRDLHELSIRAEIMQRLSK